MRQAAQRLGPGEASQIRASRRIGGKRHPHVAAAQHTRHGGAGDGRSACHRTSCRRAAAQGGGGFRGHRDRGAGSGRRVAARLRGVAVAERRQLPEHHHGGGDHPDERPRDQRAAALQRVHRRDRRRGGAAMETAGERMDQQR